MSDLTKCAACGEVRARHEHDPARCWSWMPRKQDLCQGLLEPYELPDDPEPWIDKWEDENGNV